MAVTFPKGIHPPESKEFSEHQKIEVLPTPKLVTIPLLQHTGSPAELTVKPKSVVKIGDVIGEIKGSISARVHASINGEIGRPRKVTLANGRRVFAVGIQASDDQPTAESIWDEIYGGEWPYSIDHFSDESIIEAIRNAGIVGMGGAAFPTHVKITPNPKKPIDTLLINGAECEPYLTADYRLMIEVPRAIICGALCVAKVTKAKNILICIEDNKPQAIRILQEASQSTNIKVITLRTKYPQGGEKPLIQAVTGREVPAGGLPLDIGVVVINTGTAAAIARAVLRGKPLTHRIVTVSGEGIPKPANLLVPIGTPIADLIQFCGGLPSNTKVKVVAGGPMMGFTLGSLQTPVTKGTSGIVVLPITQDDKEVPEETNCIRCGRCVDACPLNLVPTRLALAARKQNTEIAQRYAIQVCMECGCCAYVCPAKIPLVQLIRLGKIQVRRAQEKK